MAFTKLFISLPSKAMMFSLYIYKYIYIHIYIYIYLSLLESFENLNMSFNTIRIFHV